ncbi:unnamed protein product [Brachionus calyciflorus]|uniref:HAT C-terminal dimerisation domain-containing protein n=1 Tax=Brachionus calyciflorus TaxID=104777 RepID=A0A814NFD4_9BILA|nr:unnamed protein product [Brachionus calyciflorus]
MSYSWPTSNESSSSNIFSIRNRSSTQQSLILEEINLPNTPVSSFQNQSRSKKQNRCRKENFLEKISDTQELTKSDYLLLESNKEHGLDIYMKKSLNLLKKAVDLDCDFSLEFFRENIDSLGRLGEIVKVIFSITATSVPSESAFSIAEDF